MLFLYISISYTNQVLMISILYNTLFFLIPLIFLKNTSELFEFNKIITLYCLTILITTFWLIKSIKLKKIIFRRTILDWPLITFLLILFIGSFLSLDFRTSILGYYSRFNGGLFSMLSYSLLYWAFVSNLNKKEVLRSIYFILFSTAIAGILAVLEHFGFSATCGLMGLGFSNYCWVQDVQARVFSTLGQPNWLAALLVALIPITWAQILNDKKANTKYFLNIFLSILFFVTLLFTKSRSGFLAFGVESLIFWGYIFWKNKFKYVKECLILFFTFAILFFLFNPPVNVDPSPTTASNAPALEVGGTESGVIRKFVWMGAFNVFKNYPILGTGPETFAFAFPMFKPLEHNLTSEWDFIYNKAHNEYLNYLATTGVLGLISYLTIIIFSAIVIFKISDIKLKISVLSGYVALLITNFFGFSVVVTSLLFFLFPAIAIVNSTEYPVPDSKTKLNSNQIIGIIFILFVMTYMLFNVTRYWLADTHYNKARLSNNSGDIVRAKEEIGKAIKLSPKEAIYWSELSTIDADIAVLLSENDQYEKAQEFEKLATDESDKSTFLSKYNLSLKKTQISVYYKLLVFNHNYLLKAVDTNKSAIIISPNDPKLYYQMGLLEMKLNKLDDATLSLEKSVTLKPNYKEARYALGSLYKAIGNTQKANENFNYILEKIDPNDELTKKMYN